MIFLVRKFDSKKSNFKLMKTNFFITVILFLFWFSINSFAQDGEHLFKANCASCHSVGKGKLVGPDLKGVDTRHKEPWLLKWVKSSQTMIKSGDTTAVRLYSENNNLIMTDMPLDEGEIKSVLAYIKTKGDQPVTTETTTQYPVDGTATQEKGGTQASGSLLSMFSFSEYMMFLLMGLLFVVIWVMAMSIKTLSLKLQEKKNE